MPSIPASDQRSPKLATRTLYRRLLQEALGYRLQIGGVFLITVLGTPLILLIPLPLKIAVDSVIGSDPVPDFLTALLPAGVVTSETGTLLFAVALFIGIAVLVQLQEVGSLVLGTYTGEKLLMRFRTRLFAHVQRLSLSYHDTKGTTDSTYRIQYDAPAIQHILVDAVIPLITAITTLVGMVAVTALIDWSLALVALAVCPILYFVTKTFGWRLRGGWREAKELETSALSVVQEVLSALRVVKGFGAENRERERFVHRSEKGMRARIRLAFAQGGFSMIVGLTTALGTATVLYVGVRHVQTGVLSLGELLLVMAYLAQIYQPLETMSKKIADLQSSLASAERVFALLDETTDLPERPHARRLERARGAVAFRQVSFAYDHGPQALTDVSFELDPGARVGIAGTTGAGKTTLVSLLCRFYDPSNGQVLLDGLDLRDYRLEDLRRQFAIVLQDPVLFSTSIGENIAYARPDATRAEIEAAARAANAHEFIVGLSEGYETPVGDRGMRLSGGERQRVSLARAFLKDAPILILDEPTSSVDTRTEAAIMDAMTRLMSGRTTLMIAHRLSTLEMCDERLQIEGGRLVDAASIQATGQQPAPDGIGGPRGHGDRPRGRVGQWLRRASGSAP